MTYLSKKAFADSQGWAPSYVSKLGSQGRLVMAADGKKVDVEATLAMIGKTADPSKSGVADRHRAARVKREVYASDSDETPSDATTVPPVGGLPPALAGAVDFQAARTAKEYYAALTIKAEYERTCGNTVERQAVEAAAFRGGRLVRDSLLGLPPQIASELANMTDSWQIERYLADRLRQVLTDATRLGEDELKKAMKA
ncbi:Uncharacterized protein ChrSV_1535 [Chromobacterium vaccinii]|nr:Uncharacterized protein ChrSW_1535 [Chromobacterium vaccinii]QND88993.1 Uncharacterized protein ChrSV_1535 [Chromobacterium vaccinii]